MLQSIQSLVKRYGERLRGGPHAALIAVGEVWPEIIQKYRVDPSSVTLKKLDNSVLTIVCSSSEEAAHIRTVQKHIIKDIQEKTGRRVSTIVFSN